MRIVLLLFAYALCVSCTTRVLTYNLWTPIIGSENATQRLELFVNTTRDYDVLLMQEVFNVHVFDNVVAGHASWLRTQLMDRGFSHFIMPYGSNNIIQMQDDGLMVASRLPMANIDRILYKNKNFWDSWARKGAVLFTVNNVRFINTHLQAYESHEDAHTRFQQLQELKDLIDQSEKTVLGGDLNIVAGTREYEVAIELLGMKDSTHPRSAVTYPSHAPTERLDYFLLHKASGTSRPQPLCWEHVGEAYRGCSDHIALSINVA